MPLAFNSLSHGTVAFGFFNIETHMLLLDSLFFFADRFCNAVAAIAERTGEPAAQAFEGWRIRDRTEIGNLHGAIRGTDLSGFIGRTYRLFPFPEEPEAFKQSPEGQKNEGAVRESIAEFGAPEAVRIRWDPGEHRLAVCEFVFDGDAFAKLVTYVEQGGYPRWKGEVRPPYVRRMIRAVRQNPGFLAPAPGRPEGGPPG